MKTPTITPMTDATETTTLSDQDQYVNAEGQGAAGQNTVEQFWGGLGIG